MSRRFAAISSIRVDAASDQVSIFIYQALHAGPVKCFNRRTLKNITVERGWQGSTVWKVAIYFCDPNGPWQRSKNDNTNELICHYPPNGTDFSVHSQQILDAIAMQLNMRPRKDVDFKCPIEVMGQVMQQTDVIRPDVHTSI